MWMQCLRPVPGADGLYADITGNIWSYWYPGPNRYEKELIELRQKNSGNYRQVCICRHNQNRTHYVHRLVALAFKGPSPPGKTQVRHLDGNALNNVPGNLKWGSAKENGEDKVKHGTSPKGSKNGFSKLDEDAVRAIRADPSINENVLAQRYSVNRTCINKIRRNETWKHVK